MKSLERKNSILMQELHSSKKKYEEEKTRSVSTLGYRSSEDISKLRNMENELSKKDQKIRKLEKEVIKLEDENVQLNIKIMRELNEFKGSIGNLPTNTALEGA